MTDNDPTAARDGRRWVLPVVIGAVVLALGGGIGIGVALKGDSGETEDVASIASTSATLDSTNSGPAGGSTNSGGGGGAGRSEGGTTNSTSGSVATTSQPKAPPTTSSSPPVEKPVIVYTQVGDVTCVSGAPKGSVGNNPNLFVLWQTTAGTTSVDIRNASRPLGSGYPAQGTTNITYHCGGYDVNRDPASVTLVAHGPGGDTSTTVVFDVRDS